MSTPEQTIYQYLSVAREQFSANKTSSIFDNYATSTLWIPNHLIPEYIKKDLANIANIKTKNYQILCDDNKICFYLVSTLINKGCYGKVKNISGYFTLDPEKEKLNGIKTD